MGSIGKLDPLSEQIILKDMSETFEIPDGTIPESIVPSPDSTLAAYIVRDTFGAHVELSGHVQNHYDAVAGLTFSPDSKCVAYAAAREGVWYVVWGDKELGPYTDIGKTSPLVSPNSKRIAYTAMRGGQWCAVADDLVMGGPYEGFSAGGLLFSPDSQTIAYVIKRSNRWAVVANGQEQRSYQNVLQRSLTFSPDSSRLAFIACADERLFFRKRRKAFLVVDDKPGALWEHDEQTGHSGVSHEIIFSPNSQRIAYAIKQDGKSAWVVDGVVQLQHHGTVSGWGASPEWSRFPDHGKTCCRAQSLTFSSDSRHFAYGANIGGQHILLYDGEERGRHPAILNWPVVFSPDSKHVAYGVEDCGQQFIVLDGTALKRHHGICCDRGFSPDSARFVYVSMASAESLQLVVGPRSWQMPGGPLVGARLVWDDAENLHTVVGKQRRITVVRYRIC